MSAELVFDPSKDFQVLEELNLKKMFSDLKLFAFSRMKSRLRISLKSFFPPRAVFPKRW